MPADIQEKLLTQTVDAYEFRPAEPGDIERLVDLYGDYFVESRMPGQGMAFDPKRAWAAIYGAISGGKRPQIIAIEKKTGILVGVVAYNLDHDFTTEPFANLDKLYVRRRWRKSPVGRILMVLCLEIARADGVRLFNAGLSSGLPETRSAANMLVKLGFETTDDIVLARRL